MSLTHGGGKPNVSDVMNYSTPKGPTSIGNNGVGLGGDNYGVQRQPVCHDRESGSPGIGGTNHGNNPSRNR